MALVSFARGARKQLQDATQKLLSAEASFSNERKQRRQSQSEVLDLQSRLERFEEVESKLKIWETRKPKIYHYLGVFGEMMRWALHLCGTSTFR